jgi:hypothetical protein
MKASVLTSSLRDCDESYILIEKAISNEEPEIVSMLIEHGIDINRQLPKRTPDEIPQSSFEMACSDSTLEVFTVFLNMTQPRMLTKCGPRDLTPLELVVQGTSKDKTSMVKYMYAKVAPYKFPTLSTPIILQAAKEKDWDMVKCLEDLGEDIEARHSNRWGLVQDAICDDNVEMLEWFLSLSPSARQVLCVSILDGEKGQDLVDADATLLHVACESPAAMRFLLEQEIFDDVDVITEKGRTALHHAAFAGSLECCLLLIDNGSKLTLRDQDNRLPIDYALGSKESEVVLLLLKSGSPYPSNSTQDDEGRSQVPSKHRPMKLARRQFFESRIIAGELEHCKSIATQDFPIDMVLPSCGRCTPLFAAIRTGQKDIVNWLIAKGAKPMDVFCHHSSHNEVVTLAASLMNSAYCINGILSSGCLNSALWSMSLTNAIYQAVGRGSTKILLVILQHLNRNLKTY